MSIFHPYTIFPLGDSALIVDFGNNIDETINNKVFQLYYHLKEKAMPYIKDLVPAYSSLAVHYDVISVHHFFPERSAFESIAEMIENSAANERIPEDGELRKIKIPVCYSLKYALDIEELALEKNMTVEEVAALHCKNKYRVYMVGFLPGFPYMGEVDERLSCSRKSEPRLRVDPGAIGIAGTQTGIYPIASPGGWQIIGCTPVIIFNKDDLNNPVLFHAGDEVTFYPISEDEFEHFKSGHS